MGRRRTKGGGREKQATDASAPRVPSGVNLGGWLCLEDWFFSGSAGTEALSSPCKGPPQRDLTEDFVFQHFQTFYNFLGSFDLKKLPVRRRRRLWE